MSEVSDLVVLGAGPGGYTAAIRAAQLGLSVTVIERERVGGVCLNWGCIPSKSILTSADLFDAIRSESADHGIQTGTATVDFARVIDRSREAADRLAKGVESLLKKNKVKLIAGEGALTGKDSVEVKSAAGAQTVRGSNILLATGSTERLLPGLPIDGKVTFTSRQALDSRRLPASVLVIGGGVVGVEFAYIYAALGSQVTVVEMAGQLIPGADEEVAAELQRQFRKRKIQVLTGMRFQSFRKTEAGADLSIVGADGATKVLSAEQVLVAVGRKPLSESIGLEIPGVARDREFVKVGRDLRTNVPGIWAIGDLVGAPQLAHKASAEGIVVAENIKSGGSRSVDYNRIPACIYCQPEIAMIGITEKQARESGREIRVGKVPFRAIGKAVAAGHVDGFVKIVADAKYGEILGCHVIGRGATDLMGEGSLAMSLEATTSELGGTVHAHPTLAEGFMEAALAAEGHAINF